MIDKRGSFIQKAIAVHGNKYDYSKVEYVNCKTKVVITCPEHGDFSQTPDKHINCKCGCPVCAGNVAGTTDKFIKDAVDVHGNKYDYLKVKYINNKTDVCIVCPKHGDFWQKPYNHLMGNGCPVCANNIVLTTEEFVRKACEVHGDYYDYSKVVYSGNRNPVTIVCRIHGDFDQRPYAHLDGAGCPACGITKRLQSRDEEQIHKKSVATFLSRYGVTNPMFDVSVRAHHKDVVSSSEVNDKRIKTKRENNSFNVSLPEYRLGEKLRFIFGDADVFHNYKSDVYPFMCDFYIKSRDLYIELNAHWSHGGHWYTESDAAVIAGWKSKYGLTAGQTFSVRDVIKRNTARDNNLNYIVFWKTDLSDFNEWILSGCPDGHDWMSEYSWKL